MPKFYWTFGQLELIPLGVSSHFWTFFSDKLLLPIPVKFVTITYRCVHLTKLTFFVLFMKIKYNGSKGMAACIIVHHEQKSL